jgi:hypothetical protein
LLGSRCVFVTGGGSPFHFLQRRPPSLIGAKPRFSASAPISLVAPSQRVFFLLPRVLGIRKLIWLIVGDPSACVINVQIGHPWI